VRPFSPNSHDFGLVVSLRLPAEPGARGDGAGLGLVLLEPAGAEHEGAPGLDGSDDDGEQLQFSAPKRSLSCLWDKNIAKISDAKSRI
jgi:hypothetical protein